MLRVYIPAQMIVNLLAAGKAPKEVAIYLAGGSLTALNKGGQGKPMDVRPIYSSPK